MLSKSIKYELIFINKVFFKGQFNKYFFYTEDRKNFFIFAPEVQTGALTVYTRFFIHHGP